MAYADREPCLPKMSPWLTEGADDLAGDGYAALGEQILDVPQA
jgi:hypothetical protein